MLNPVEGNFSDERPGTAGGDTRYPNEAHNNRAAPLFLSTIINRAERVECLKLALDSYDANELVEYDVDTLWGDALLEMVIRAERQDVDFLYALADALWHAGCLSLACEDGQSRLPRDLRDRASDIESALVEKGHEISPGEVSALAAALDRGEVLSLTARQQTVLALVRPYLS